MKYNTTYKDVITHTGQEKCYGFNYRKSSHDTHFFSNQGHYPRILVNDPPTMLKRTDKEEKNLHDLISKDSESLYSSYRPFFDNFFENTQEFNHFIHKHPINKSRNYPDMHAILH
jgi:hypothetical protein